MSKIDIIDDSGRECSVVLDKDTKIETKANGTEVNTTISSCGQQVATSIPQQQSPSANNSIPAGISVNQTCQMSSMKDQLLAQLHEQYAINNNAGMQSVISLLVGMFAVLGAFGYVLLHTADTCSNRTEVCFDYSSLLFTFASSMIVLLIMTHICVYQGTAQRLEQFITYKIRDRYGLLSEDTVFPDKYKPTGKNFLDFIQGLYREFIFTFIGVAIFLSCTTASALARGNVLCASYCWPFWSTVAVFLFGTVASMVWHWRKYANRDDEYKEKNAKKEEKKKENHPVIKFIKWAALILFIASVGVLCIHPFISNTGKNADCNSAEVTEVSSSSTAE